MEKYEPDFLDEAVAFRAQTEPEVGDNWSAIKLVSEIRAVRERKGLTQAQVAAKMGIPQPHVVRIERKPWSTGFGRILAYAQAVGVDFSVAEHVLV